MKPFVVLSAAAVVLAFSMTAAAQSSLDDDIRQIMNSSDRIKGNAGAIVGRDWAARAGRLADHATAAAAAVGPPPQMSSAPVAGVMSGEERHFEIYASWSMGREALRDLFKEYAGRKDVVIVFRGILDGERINNAIDRLHGLMAGITPAPNVLLDPTRFRRASLTEVPAVADVDRGRLVAVARGTVSVDYLDRAEQDDKDGDLGAVGPTGEIAETDLIDEMQDRVSHLDLRGAKKRTQETYWARARMVDLPQASEPRTRTVDPTVAVTRDIVTADGTVIARAGDKINPLERLPFSLRLVVFDATSPPQVEEAAKLAQGAGRTKHAVLIATKVDREGSWAGFKKLELGLGAPVYLLTADVQERFKIERVPAIVEADGAHFTVTEIPPGEDQ